jgi:hypothetical protein
MPGLSSPRPAGRCLAVESQAHRDRGRAGAWLSCFARRPSRGRAALVVKERCGCSVAVPGLAIKRCEAELDQY